MRMHLVVLSALLLGTAAWAQEEVDTSGVTVARGEEVTRGYLKDEAFGIKPQVGVLAFKDTDGTNTARGAVGIGLEWNATKALGLDPTWYFGPSSGVIFSHLGSPSSNFFGSDADANRQIAEGANMLFIPANLKLGYNFSDHYRLSVHGGGNAIYRSVARSMNLGDGSDRDGSLWKVYPNVGADLEIAMGRNVSLLLRPDLTITPNDDFFTGTAALGINIG